MPKIMPTIDDSGNRTGSTVAIIVAVVMACVNGGDSWSIFYAVLAGIMLIVRPFLP